MPVALAAPVEVRRATVGVWVVSVCYLLIAVFAVLTRDAAVESSLEVESNLTEAEVVAAVNGLVLIAVVIGVAIGAIGIAAAVHLPRGRSWARVAATVVVSVALLFSLLGLVGSELAATAVHVLVLLGGALVLLTLYRAPASAFFAGPRTR